MKNSLVFILIVIIVGSCTFTDNSDPLLNIFAKEYNVDFNDKKMIFHIRFPTCESCFIALTEKLKSVVPKSDQLIIVSDERFRRDSVYYKLEALEYEIIYDDKRLAETTEYSDILKIPSIILVENNSIDTILQVNSLNVEEVFEYAFGK